MKKSGLTGRVLLSTFIIFSMSCVVPPGLENHIISDTNLMLRVSDYYLRISDNNYGGLWDMASLYARQNYENRVRFTILMRTKYGGSDHILYNTPRIISMNRYFAVTEGRVKSYSDRPYVCERIVWVKNNDSWYFSDVRIGCLRFPSDEEFMEYYK